jgi:F0F1-type ATP synthase epsilon subunit
MPRALRLRVVTPVETLLEVEEANWVHVQLADEAGISIYPGHAALLAQSVSAPLRYADASGNHIFDVAGGIVQVEGDDVTVLTSSKMEARETRRPPAGPDVERFQRLARELQARLQSEEEDLFDGIYEET